MARSRGVAALVERVLGTPVAATSPVAGGDTCVATRVRLGDGRSALVKTRSGAPDDFFASEARGLRWLAEPDVVPVAQVLAVERDCLVVTWIEPGRPTPESAAALGQGLARLHASGADGFGADRDGFVGSLPLPHRPAPTWPEFFAVRRLLPYLALAVDRGRIDAGDAAAVEGVVRRIEGLAGPAEPPARLHGDLWSGNVVWGAERAHLVDPAAHGGHRETDLAMLALFGAPHLERLVAAYDEEQPLADGWRDRQPLHQLFPVLVHAALFGGHYGARAGELSRRL